MRCFAPLERPDLTMWTMWRIFLIFAERYKFDMVTHTFELVQMQFNDYICISELLCVSLLGFLSEVLQFLFRNVQIGINVMFCKTGWHMEVLKYKCSHWTAFVRVQMLLPYRIWMRNMRHIVHIVQSGLSSAAKHRMQEQKWLQRLARMRDKF
jgi:hypothetical protein